MKKSKLINAEISYVISKMGHQDELTIADAGLPIPKQTTRIDLAVSKNIPRLKYVLESVLSELEVEEMIVADDARGNNSGFLTLIERFCNSNNVKLTYISHKQLKERTSQSKAVIRSGEFSPFANVILVSGVVF